MKLVQPRSSDSAFDLPCDVGKSLILFELSIFICKMERIGVTMKDH